MDLIIQREVNRLVKSFTLTGAVDVSVESNELTANSVVLITLKTVGGTQGQHPTVTPTASGFDVRGTAGDTSIYNYVVL